MLRWGTNLANHHLIHVMERIDNNYTQHSLSKCLVGVFTVDQLLSLHFRVSHAVDTMLEW